VEIQLLSKHGLSLRRIAADVGCAVNTVQRHLALEAVPKYERRVKRTTKLAAHESYLRERQTAARPNWIPATVRWHGVCLQQSSAYPAQACVLGWHRRVDVPAPAAPWPVCLAGGRRHHPAGQCRAMAVAGDGRGLAAPVGAGPGEVAFVSVPGKLFCL
jgi:hypothetical protein